eukprot:scaffold196520_cov48-Attheya_sp.AAC.1
MIIPSGGVSAGTLFGYASPALAISDELMWQNSASGFTLPEQGSDVLLYCRDDWRMMTIASLSYGMTQKDVPDDLRNFSIAFPDSSCAFYKGTQIGTAEDLMGSLTRKQSFDTTTCTEPGFDHDAFELTLKVIEPNSKPSMQPSASRSPSLTPMAFNENALSNIPSTLEFRTKEPDIQAKRTRAPVPFNERDQILTSQHPSNSFDPVSKPSMGPSESISPTMKKSRMPSASIGPSLNRSLLPTATVSDSPSENSSDLPTQRIGPSVKPSSTPSISIDPSIASSIGPSESPKARRTRAPVHLNEKDQKLTSQHPSLLPTVSDSPSENSSDLPTQSIGPSIKPSSTPSISIDPSIASSIGPSKSPKARRTQAPVHLNEKDQKLTYQNPSMLPTLSVSPSENPSDTPTTSTGPSIKPSSTPSISVDPSSAPSVSLTPTTEPSELPSKSLGASLTPSIMPTQSVSPSKNPSDVPTQSVGPSRGPFMNPSIS